MKNYQSNEIRNVVVMGHSGCGKTTIAEAALNVSGVTSRLGRVDDGNTVSDYDDEERRRKVSINTSIIPVEWLDTKINLLDTPGYFDFVGEVVEALAVADLALIVVNAKSGVEVGTEKAWEYAEERNMPRMIFVNGMDDENADFDKVVADLKAKFGVSIAPLQVPFKDGTKFKGFVNVIKKEGREYKDGQTKPCDVPAGLTDTVDEIRLTVEEAVAGADDDLMDKFLNEERLSVEEIHAGLQKGIADRAVAPVVCGAATMGIGVAVMLNSIVKFVPPASELLKSVKVTDVKTETEIELKCNDSEPFSAFVFKTISDPFVGRLSIFRVFSGVMKKDTPLYNPRADLIEKAGRIFIMRGKEQIEVSELHTGDIGAVAKLQSTSTQDTLCTKEKPVLHKEIEFPGSLFSMAIMPKAKGDEDKIGQAISKMMEEEKTLRFEVNAETKQSLIYGIGENQLDVLVGKCRNKYKLEVELANPIVPYREMIKTKVARVQGKYKKQSGGHGQYGDVYIDFEPSNDQSQAYIFEEQIVGGVVPRQYFPAVEKGIQECVKAGPLAGYPVVGIKATLVFGSYHDVDSSEMAFKMATHLAFKEGFMKAKPTLLEPVVSAVVSVPDDYTGDIMGDMNKRRGRILGMDKKGSKQNISAEVPMAEMFKYATDLRSMTQGRGSFTMKFERYEEAPMEVQTKVIEARKKEMEQEHEK